MLFRFSILVYEVVVAGTASPPSLTALLRPPPWLAGLGTPPSPQPQLNVVARTLDGARLPSEAVVAPGAPAWPLKAGGAVSSRVESPGACVLELENTRGVKRECQ
jgi:hypothetical protein